MKDNLSIVETAQILGFSEAQIWREIQAGKYPGARKVPRPGGKKMWQIPRESVGRRKQEIHDDLALPSTRDAAAFLNVSSTQIGWLLRRGAFPNARRVSLPGKTGIQIRIPYEDLAAYEKRRAQRGMFPR
jgi:hypothetical protein